MKNSIVVFSFNMLWRWRSRPSFERRFRYRLNTIANSEIIGDVFEMLDISIRLSLTLSRPRTHSLIENIYEYLKI